MLDSQLASFTSFDGEKRIASGDLATNALAAKRALASGAQGLVLTFDDRTGGVVELDLRGTDEEVVARLVGSESSGRNEAPLDSVTDSTPEPKRRGRPKLGVVAREVTLLPRHWEWLESQPGGASVTLRKLVEQARRANADKDRRRHFQERAYRFMVTITGDMAGFEQATRALFANDRTKFDLETEVWPVDVRDYARNLAFEAQPAIEYSPFPAVSPHFPETPKREDK